jgi:hypothetical protein
MLRGEELPVGEAVMDRVDNHRVVDRGVRRDNVGDQVRALRLHDVVAALAEVDLVSDPG